MILESKLYRRALDADPNDAITLGNYACLLLGQGRRAEGLARLDAAFGQLNSAAPPELALECWMYAYCCRPISAQAAALGELKRLITVDRLSTGDWDFSGVIAQAKALGHPQGHWLDRLAEVLAGRAEPASLAAWPDWCAA